MSRWLGERGERLAIVLLVAVVVGSAQALGAMHVPVLLITALLGLGAWLACYGAGLTGGGLFPAPALIMLSLAAYTALQAIPLPFAAVSVLAPASAEAWAGALAPFREPAPGFVSLSLDPGASWIEALKWTLYAATFSAAAALGERKGAHFGAAVTLVSGVLLALTSMGHRLAGATTIFGVYSPIGEFAPEKLGPLLNPNNLAGYMNLAVFCGFGLMAMRKPPAPRWLVAIGVALALAVVLETGSRGGLLALGVGMLTLVAGLSLARTSSDGTLAQGRTVRWMIAAVSVSGLALALLAASRGPFAGFEQQNVDKLKVVLWVKPMILDHFWFGIGRGAFESVFAKYRMSPDNVIYSHPENFLVQWISEWGVVVGIAALVAFSWTLRPRAIGLGRHAVAIGVWAALLMLLAQNVVDLGLEVPAVALAITVALGACWGGARKTEPKLEARRLRSLGWALPAVGAALIVVAGYRGWRTVGSDRLSLNELLGTLDLAQPRARQELRSELRAATLRHPAEPYFPRIGAYLAWRGGRENPLPWVDRSLERGLTSGRTHYLLARILASWNRKAQALLEFRLAVEYDPSLRDRVARRAVSLSQDASDLVRVVPQGANRGKMIETIASLLNTPARAAFREPFLTEAVARYPELLEPRVALAADLIAVLQAGEKEPGCAGERRAACIARAERQLTAVGKLNPNGAELVELKARLLLATDRPGEAEALLATECGRFPANRRCAKLRVQAAARARSGSRVQSAARAFVAGACDTPTTCADSYSVLGDTFASTGDHRQALVYYQRAAREDPNDQRWHKVAEAASKVGAHMEAAEALSRIESQARDPRLRARIEEERRRALLQNLAPK